MLKLISIVQVFGLYGFLSGLASALFYAFSENAEKTFGTIALVFLGAPILQSLILMMYALIGYPIYQYAVRRGILRMAEFSKIEK